MLHTAILCPLDFSVASAALVAYAAALAASTGAALRLLHVLEPQVVVPLVGEQDTWVATQLAGYHAVAQQAGALHTSTAIRSGAPATVILAEAQHWPADLIVIGAHGHTRLLRFLMGSTAEEVVRKASCATLLVKHCAVPAYRQSA